MASKRYLLDERIMVWKEYMSKVATWVKILDSNIPIVEITMSNFKYKYEEYEHSMRGSVSSTVVNMGCVTTKLTCGGAITLLHKDHLGKAGGW
jgi:hypothetical protein